MTNKEEKSNIKITTSGQYIKDLSFENPKAPEVYTVKNPNPKISVSIDINSKKLQEELYEVELIINAEASYDSDNKKMFVIELTYAGIFNIKDDNYQSTKSIREKDSKKDTFYYEKEDQNQDL